MGTPSNYRPLIELNTTTKQVTHNGIAVRVVLRKNLISVGCSDITPYAAKYIWEQYCKEFPPVEKEKEVIL